MLIRASLTSRGGYGRFPSDYGQYSLVKPGRVGLKAAAGVTNYVTLLDQILRWPVRHASSEDVLLVTFNYDTMLDAACA